MHHKQISSRRLVATFFLVFDMQNVRPRPIHTEDQHTITLIMYFVTTPHLRRVLREGGDGLGNDRSAGKLPRVCIIFAKTAAQ